MIKLWYNITKESGGSMKFIGVYRKCDWVTMTGTSFAILGIINAFNKRPTYAVFCLILAAICDAFDGVVARRFRSLKEQEIYGIELDSLSDAISFGVLPMVITLNIAHNNILTYIICIFFCVCGVIRLAYFNMLTTTKKKVKNEFIGIPITASAIIIPLVYFMTMLISKKYNYIIFPVVLFITGILYITPIKLKKPTSREKAILSILGLLAIIICLLKIYIF